MSLTLSGVAVLYLVAVGLIAASAALGAPLHTAAKAGQITSLMLVALVLVVDVASLVGAHRPREPATHLGYLAAAACVPALALMPVGTESGAPDPSRPDRTAMSLVSVSSLVTAVVVVRLAQTWVS